MASGEPGVQRELGGLARDAGEQQQRDGGGVVEAAGRDGAEDAGDPEGAGVGGEREEADEEGTSPSLVTRKALREADRASGVSQ